MKLIIEIDNINLNKIRSLQKNNHINFIELNTKKDYILNSDRIFSQGELKKIIKELENYRYLINDTKKYNIQRIITYFNYFVPFSVNYNKNMYFENGYIKYIKRT